MHFASHPGQASSPNYTTSIDLIARTDYFDDLRGAPDWFQFDPLALTAELQALLKAWIDTPKSRFAFIHQSRFTPIFCLGLASMASKSQAPHSLSSTAGR